ncbi:hypothetical protein RIR_jg10760.t1 [Rhizophagus irregularis DAOM 181602=DAOM 197198]|nr:hypothetical protein RIR_jg10760.t1 [Rhizophagus irregularis DAOM 181602=DAOM 197198]
MEKIKKYERALNTGEADPVLLMVLLRTDWSVPLRLLRLYISPPGSHPRILNVVAPKFLDILNHCPDLSEDNQI